MNQLGLFVLTGNTVLRGEKDPYHGLYRCVLPQLDNKVKQVPGCPGLRYWEWLPVEVSVAMQRWRKPRHITVYDGKNRGVVGGPQSTAPQVFHEHCHLATVLVILKLSFKVFG